MVAKIRQLFDAEGWLSLLGYVLSLHAGAFGLSFALNTDDAQRTLLYKSLVDVPFMTPEAFGWILTTSGVVTFIGYFARSLKWSKSTVKYGSYIQFIIYLFMTILYCLNGNYWYAAAIAVPWVPLVYFISNAFYNLPKHKSLEELRREWGLSER